MVPSNGGLVLIVEELVWIELVARAGAEAKEAAGLLAYLDDLTLVTEDSLLEDAIRALEAVLGESTFGRQRNEGRGLDSLQHRTEQRKSRSHVGSCGPRWSILACCLGAYDHQSTPAPTAIPMGNANNLEPSEC